ncbi:hypothetical protein F5887DRAFT_1074204 [Amanita rubescens]|nr:hypothetical protein F5887DRAFT_1074204 [Amanita rubescens]
MYLSIISILFIYIYTICASPLPIASSMDNISAISKREDIPAQLDIKTLIEMWRDRNTNSIAGLGTERAYKTRYLEQPVLIKGYFQGTRSSIQMKKRAEANVELHVKLGDLVAWGKHSPTTADDPHYMVVIRSDDRDLSASSARSILGLEGVKAVQSAAIDNISKLHKIDS